MAIAHAKVMMGAFAVAVTEAVVLGRHAEAGPIAYADRNSEYVQVDLGTGTLRVVGPMSPQLLIGAFVGGDSSTEYAIDIDDELYAIDVVTGNASPLGSLYPVMNETQDTFAEGIVYDSSRSTTWLIGGDASCTGYTLLAVEAPTAQAKVIATGSGCPRGVVVIDGNLYTVDIGNSALQQLGPDTPIGSLGFAVGDVSALFVDPISGELFMIATDLDSATNGLYQLDVTTGLATFLMPYADHYTAFAVSGDSGFDSIFENGFD